MKINFALLGDLAYNGLISSQPEKNLLRYSKINTILADIDIVFANLEVPVKAGIEENEFKKVNYYSELSVTKELLKNQNVGCVSLANNHIYDYKMSGLRATIELLEEMNIYHTGAGWTQEHVDPVIICKDDKKYGFIAYVDKSTNPGAENFPELFINYLDVDRIKQDIDLIRNKVDVLICSLHWGIDYSFYPTKEQVSIAHELADSGIDIVMGHHPHTIQPFEQYMDAYIFYSLGGLTYGDDYIDGKLRSLKRKTKISFFPIFSDKETNPQFISTRELKGNYIIVESRDIWEWSKRMWRLTRLSHRSVFIFWAFKFQENILSRFYEFIFGYYRNLRVDLFSLSTFKKLKKILIQNSGL
jgi:poly-gamma-glutamate synthesis protein (capsule biosynthesis protein)